MAFLVYKAYVNHHVRPSVIMGLCSQNDIVGMGERAFMLAAEKLTLENGDVPVAIANFAKKERL